MKNKIKSLLNGKTELQNYVDDFRIKNIPKQYNQIKLADYLDDDELDHYFSISNRTDGKSFNYIHFFMNLSKDLGVGFCLIARTWYVRDTYQDLIYRIADISETIDRGDINFTRTHFYLGVLYKGKMIGVVVDLNQATNLKNLSSLIVNYPIMIYDEFLALKENYVDDEFNKLKTIYESINREKEIPFIKFPKIFYLGNAVNFSSPILANLKMYNILEKHPINSIKKYQNIVLEINRNDNANEIRNLRAFNQVDDAMTTGQFFINSHNLAIDNDRNAVMLNHEKVIVKINDMYLHVDFNFDKMIIILSIVGQSEDYDYNFDLSDNTEKSIYLKESYFSNTYIKKHNKGVFLYDNMFSKEYITEDGKLLTLKILRLIAEKHEENSQLSNADRKEKQFKDMYLEQTKKSLVKKFLNYD